MAELFDVADRVLVRVGTLSKALKDLAGGFVAGSRLLVDWLANRARSYVFSTAHPPAVYAAAWRRLQRVRDEPRRRTELLARAAELRERLAADGWNIGAGTSQIIPIVIGDPARTMRLSAALREQGFWVPGIRPPSVPAGESLLRVSLSYAHTSEQLTALANLLAHLRPA